MKLMSSGLSSLPPSLSSIAWKSWSNKEALANCLIEGFVFISPSIPDSSDTMQAVADSPRRFPLPREQSRFHRGTCGRTLSVRESSQNRVGLGLDQVDWP